MKNLLVLGSLLTLLGSGPLHAESPGGPTVVELFTSQSCYSCPPAEAYLGELAKQQNLVALEFHVTYWDDLVYGAAGRWKDVHSQKAFTRRQQVYARNLPDGQSYTPQIVIDGRAFAVGSNRGDVSREIRRSKGGDHRLVEVAVAAEKDGKLSVNVTGGSKEAAAIWLVRFTKEVATVVRAGENKGKTLTNHNIVTQMTRIGDWTGQPVSVKVDHMALKPEEGCAVLVQSPTQGPVMGAAYCPGLHG